MLAHLALACFLSIAGLVSQTTGPAAPADEVKQRILDRAGIEAWKDGKRLAFTFNVARPDGSTTSVKHDWDLTTGIDTVTWDGKTESINAWDFNAETATEDEKAAFARWTNDSYWLMAPLKIGDPGCNLETLGEGEIDGKTFTRLRLSFDKVGLTPGDQYVMYVDDEGLVRYWDFLPNAQRKTTWSWEGYEDFDGLILATEHKPVGDGARIFFTDVSFEKKQSAAGG